ncbi:MAG: tRNA uridine-5-carboxymethylaminomethyl(34) synthesis GTPase MnmE [Candidatus Izemoplasmatales bacterium]|nr:tRNA uridine-5-carboxymethylaminomethyl(34) synthesis GTPase MnmE [Candidatus Izemoplasmatales bacterium]MDD3865525.1 tRNA uridine-5-carboxymethylaminomethyl(34) synthesis GTPase MnmE [Candidatus Izemoplasmatales bacterium]
MLYDTIVGIATLQGMSAINVVRISGIDAIAIVNKIFKGKDLSTVSSHTVHYGHIIDGNTIIDEVLVSVFFEPKTFTGENVVEISTHGGYLIPNKIVELLVKNGCRIAENGEFSKRAFLNGRIDLSQAESIMDVISAQTETQLRLANRGLHGDVKALVGELQTTILDIIAKIEVNIDYPEYDDATVMTDNILRPDIKKIVSRLSVILHNSETGKVIREGIKTVILGKPNVGKSSLLNSLLKEDKAIVTEISGTTRDLVEGDWNLGGVILNLVDTAGIRNTDDAVEKIGIIKAKKALSEADLVLLVLDQSRSLTTEDIDLLTLTKNKPRIIVGNKIDLGKHIDIKLEKTIDVSAKNSTGLDQLEAEVKRLFIDESLLKENQLMLANARHIGKIGEAKTALEDALKACENHFPVDIIEIDIRKAWEVLGEITGETGNEVLIHALFSRFCLGK